MEDKKEILGLWIGEAEGKHVWMQIFDEIKARGVKAIFPHTIFQRCIIHLVRNSIKYVPSKDYKAYTQNLKRVYGATSLKSAEAAFERFKNV